MALAPQQEAQLRRAIDARLQALIAEIREGIADTRERPFSELAGPAPDAGDESVASLIYDLEQADVTRDLTELRALEAARARFENGSYGTCAGCGGEIGLERLLASPAALRCIECQRVYEKTHASPPTPGL